MAASGLAPECLPFVSLARREQAAPVCTLLGFAERTSPAGAVLVNGALAHALDFEDADDESLCHPNAQIVPVLLALAESEAGVAGRELLAAMAVGSYLTCGSRSRSGRRSPNGAGTRRPLAGFGATAAAATCFAWTSGRHWMRFHSSSASSAAMARSSREAAPRCAACATHSPRMRLSSRHSWPGTACAIQAPFEGPGGLVEAYAGGGADLTGALDGLGSAYAGERVSFKLWPSCRATHPFVEGALALRAQHGLRPGRSRGCGSSDHRRQAASWLRPVS